jgi:hypothetical protein
MAVESLPVGEVGVGLSGIRGGVVPARLLKRLNERELTYHPPTVRLRLARSSRSPGSVLNGGTSPVLSFQNRSL